MAMVDRGMGKLKIVARHRVGLGKVIIAVFVVVGCDIVDRDLRGVFLQ